MKLSILLVRGSLAALLVVPVATAVSPYVAPASATTHTCGSNWCSGTDGAGDESDIATNIQGYLSGDNRSPQIYTGEVGSYLANIAWKNPPSYSCSEGSTNPEGGCFLIGPPGGASGANTRYSNNTGIGTSFYYVVGGPASSYKPSNLDSYCWGRAQGQDALSLIENSSDEFAAYIIAPSTITMDIETVGTAPNDNGWYEGNTDAEQAANRDTIDGFWDWVTDSTSQDSTCNSPSTSGYVYQPAIYTSQEIWYTMFSTGYNGNGSHGDLPNAQVWTTEENAADSDCSAYVSAQPPNWSPGTCPTDWFAGSSYRHQWQWEQYPAPGGSDSECVSSCSGDWDLLYEPFPEPVLNETFGD